MSQPLLPYYKSFNHLTARSHVTHVYFYFICAGCHIQQTLVYVCLSVRATHTIAIFWTLVLCSTLARDRAVSVSSAGGVVSTILCKVTWAYNEKKKCLTQGDRVVRGGFLTKGPRMKPSIQPEHEHMNISQAI